MNRNRDDFSARMALGRDLAASARYKGKSTGKPAAGHTRGRDHFASYTELDKLEWHFKEWRKDVEYQCLGAVEWALFGEEWQQMDGVF